eukprot:1144141-Pelagomonas_calceolata.AAC.4
MHNHAHCKAKTQNLAHTQTGKPSEETSNKCREETENWTNFRVRHAHQCAPHEGNAVSTRAATVFGYA